MFDVHVQAEGRFCLGPVKNINGTNRLSVGGIGQVMLVEWIVMEK
jgi:hypothetical protein